jgi:hypothetical protein
MVRTSPRLAQQGVNTIETIKRIEDAATGTCEGDMVVRTGGGGRVSDACETAAQDGADAIVGAGARAAGGDEDTQNGATTVVEAGARSAVSEAGALGGSRIGQKAFLPTALLKQHLPAGMGSMTRVPRLMDIEAENDAARLEEYIATIRRTAKVFEICECKEKTLEEHDLYMVWLNSWACLSGFGSYVIVDEKVCAYRVRDCCAHGVGGQCVLLALGMQVV